MSHGLSHPPTNTPFQSFFLLIFTSIMCLSLIDPLHPHIPPALFLSFTNQGSKKGWSDYRRTAEEDREQPQSPRFPQQEWPSTCLKNMNPTSKNTRDLSVCVVANHSLTGWLHLNWKQMEMEEKYNMIQMRAFIVPLKDIKS